MNAPVQSAKKSDIGETAKPSASGGCSLGCAWVFVLAGVVFPIWHFATWPQEPEFLFAAVMVAGPAFLGAHLLAFVAVRSRDSKTVARGNAALRLMWGGVGVVVLAVVLDWLF